MAAQPGPAEVVGCKVYADPIALGTQDGYRGVVVEIYPDGRRKSGAWTVKFEYPKRHPGEQQDFGWINELTWDGAQWRCTYYDQVAFQKELHDRGGQLSFF